MGLGHEHDDDWHEGPRFFFSLTEVLHLAASALVLTLIFSFFLLALEGRTIGLDMDLAALARIAPWAALAVLPAFLLHELAHKFVAQHKDMWAEFRANFVGLVGGLVLSAITGLLFAIPGAVHIVGDATHRDSGVISIVGPLVNLFIGYGAFLLSGVFGELPAAGLADFYDVIWQLNVVLAAFNMIPLGPLDGRKVWRWSKLGFFGVWALVVALPLLVFARL